MVTTGSTIRPSESTRVTILSRVNPHAFNSSRRSRELTPSPTFAPRRFSFVSSTFHSLSLSLSPFSFVFADRFPLSFLSPRFRPTFSSNLIQFQTLSDQFRSRSRHGSSTVVVQSRGFIYEIFRRMKVC